MVSIRRIFLPIHIGRGNLSLKLHDIVVLSVTTPNIFFLGSEVHKGT